VGWERIALRGDQMIRGSKDLLNSSPSESSEHGKGVELGQARVEVDKRRKLFLRAGLEKVLGDLSTASIGRDKMRME